MLVLGIDPGNQKSALVWYDTARRSPLRKAKVPNEEALAIVADPNTKADHLAIEMAESFGAKVWSQVFVTVWWTGRFCQAWAPRPHTLVTRREVKMHIAASGKAKDGQIRNCLIERWDGEANALGTKERPGPLRGITADCWQALALAVTWSELHVERGGQWRSDKAVA